MPSASTLALGHASYQLLDIVDNEITDADAQNVSVSQRGSSTLIGNTEPGGGSVDGFGLGVIGVDTNESSELIDSAVNDKISLRGDFAGFSAYTGEGKDNLSISGDLTDAEFVLDDQSAVEQFNDLLNIRGDLQSSDPNSSVRNEIWTGGGDDTVRISGIASDTDVFLGSGDDSLLVGGSSNRLYVSGDAGRDYVELRGDAEDVIIQAGDDDDTVVLRGNLYGSGSSSISSSSEMTAAMDLGDGNDSLILGDGASYAQINTGSGLDTLRLTGYFETSDIHLDGSPSGNDGGDLISLSPRTIFDDVSLKSSNVDGDTMVVGADSQFYDSNLSFGSGDDSLVFGPGFGDIDSLLDLGEGADTVVFGPYSGLDGTTIDLGSDDQADLIRFADFSDIEYVTIEGAGANDVLYIGYQEYHYGTGVGSSLSASESDPEWMDDWFAV